MNALEMHCSFVFFLFCLFAFYCIVFKRLKMIETIPGSISTSMQKYIGSIGSTSLKNGSDEFFPKMYCTNSVREISWIVPFQHVLENTVSTVSVRQAECLSRTAV